MVTAISTSTRCAVFAHRLAESPEKRPRRAELHGRERGHRQGARHPDTLHHSPRTHVVLSGEGDNLAEAQDVESVAEGRSGGLGGVAASPVSVIKAPPHFDGGHEWRVERGYRQSHEPDERSRVDDFNGPKPEAAFLEPGLDPIRHRVALFARQRRRKELGDARVLIDGSKAYPVSARPAAQTQASGRELRKIAQAPRSCPLVCPTHRA